MLTLSGETLRGDSGDANLLPSATNSGLIEITSGTYGLASIDCPDSNSLVGTAKIDAGATLWVREITQEAVIVSGTLILDGSLLSQAAPLDVVGAGTDACARAGNAGSTGLGRTWPPRPPSAFPGEASRPEALEWLGIGCGPLASRVLQAGFGSRLMHLLAPPAGQRTGTLAGWEAVAGFSYALGTVRPNSVLASP